MLTSSLIIAVCQSLLFRKEKKLVAIIVYSTFVPVATGGFRIILYSPVVVAVCGQIGNESGIMPYSQQLCSTAFLEW